MQKKKSVSKKQIKLSPELQSMALHRLGSPIIDVELAPEQMEQLYKMSIKKFDLYSVFCKLDNEKINIVKENWVALYFSALCKETLGLIRGKFNGEIPMPNSQLATLDYSILLNESRLEQEELISLLLRY